MTAVKEKLHVQTAVVEIVSGTKVCEMMVVNQGFLQFLYFVQCGMIFQLRNNILPNVFSPSFKIATTAHFVKHSLLF